MNKHDLENALKRLAAQPTPQLSADFEQGVWREIRSRTKALAPESFWDMLNAVFLRPRWVVATVAVTLTVSVIFSAFENGTPRSTHRFLNLGVFSADAPTLPSTLLADYAR